MNDLLERYQNLIKETKVYPSEIGIAYTSLGLAGEAGEIANKVKKLYRDKGLLDVEQYSITPESFPKTSFKTIVDAQNDIKAELGDVIWYIVALAQEFNLTLEEIMEYNISKLLGRRERGTLQGSGDNR